MCFLKSRWKYLHKGEEAAVSGGWNERWGLEDDGQMMMDRHRMWQKGRRFPCKERHLIFMYCDYFYGNPSEARSQRQSSWHPSHGIWDPFISGRKAVKLPLGSPASVFFCLLLFSSLNACEAASLICISLAYVSLSSQLIIPTWQNETTA